MRGLSLRWLDLAFATNDGECAVTVAPGTRDVANELSRGVGGRYEGGFAMSRRSLGS
jgi:hypothetical protein